MIIHSQVFAAKIQGKKKRNLCKLFRYLQTIFAKANNQEQKQQTAKPKRINNNKTK